MKRLSLVKILTGPDTGRRVFKESDADTKLITATYDLDGEQIVDLGNHEWTQLNYLGEYEDDDLERFWELVEGYY